MRVSLRNGGKTCTVWLLLCHVIAPNSYSWVTSLSCFKLAWDGSEDVGPAVDTGSGSEKNASSSSWIRMAVVCSVVFCLASTVRLLFAAATNKARWALRVMVYRNLFMFWICSLCLKDSQHWYVLSDTTRCVNEQETLMSQKWMAQWARQGNLQKPSADAVHDYTMTLLPFLTCEMTLWPCCKFFLIATHNVGMVDDVPLCDLGQKRCHCHDLQGTV